jgi:valyl-tRNA synthetase
MWNWGRNFLIINSGMLARVSDNYKAALLKARLIPSLLSNDDKWILIRLDRAIREVTEALNTYHFNEATQVLYRFFWSDYCDWYIEASKAVLQGKDETRKANTLAVIDFVLGNTLRLFHRSCLSLPELLARTGFNKMMLNHKAVKTIMYSQCLNHLTMILRILWS